MNRSLSFIGLDIGKKVIDVAVPMNADGYHCFRINNSPEGYKKLEIELAKRQAELEKKKVKVDWGLVSEATGIYYVPIHEYFVRRNWFFCVVNPLSIAKYRTQELKIHKTDKEDCKLIATYAKEKGSVLMATPIMSEEVRKLKQLQVLRRTLQRNSQRIGGVNEIVIFANLKNNYIDEFLGKAIIENQDLFLELEARIIDQIKKVYPEEYRCLKSIPGVGNNLLVEIVLETDNLKRFKNLQGFQNYAGVVPAMMESGTSVYKNPKLAKTANRKLRKALYLSSLSASKANAECKALYDRLPKHLMPKQKLIHVAKKLALQIWHCLKHKEMYKTESER